MLSVKGNWAEARGRAGVCGRGAFQACTFITQGPRQGPPFLAWKHSLTLKQDNGQYPPLQRYHGELNRDSYEI